MIAQAPFGRTGHKSSRTIFGGFAVGMLSQAEADRVLDLLLEYGVNHIDTAPSYGEAELRIGPWMEQYRQEFFLATKVDKRTYQEAREQIQQSLERLRVDQVDLLQLHHLVDEQEWETAMGPGGALEAIIEAREQGWTRFLGVTGHDVAVTEMHRRSLERFDFDSVLLPYNYMMMQNPDYAAGFEQIVATCQERNIAVQTIKSLARDQWGDQPQTRATWYQPLEEQADIDRAVHYVLSRPALFLNTSGDQHLLAKILEAADRFQEAPDEQAMQAMAAELKMAPLFT